MICKASIPIEIFRLHTLFLRRRERIWDFLLLETRVD